MHVAKNIERKHFSGCCCFVGCGDKAGSLKCAAWQSVGRCKKFPRVMRRLCAKTCGMCESRPKKCHDMISTNRCRSFLLKGLCRSVFYNKICNLTCNMHSTKACRKCDASFIYVGQVKIKVSVLLVRLSACPKGRLTKSRCDPRRKVRHITHYGFRRRSTDGKCVPMKSIKVIPCGSEYLVRCDLLRTTGVL